MCSLSFPLIVGVFLSGSEGQTLSADFAVHPLLRFPFSQASFFLLRLFLALSCYGCAPSVGSGRQWQPVLQEQNKESSPTPSGFITAVSFQYSS